VTSRGNLQIMASTLNQVTEAREESWDEDRRADRTAIAVTAHSLLQSVSVILAAAEMIQTHGDQIGDRRQDELLDLIGAQGRHIAGVLVDLMRGVPPEVLEVLDELRPSPPAGLDSLDLIPIPVDWD
jgi:signal transduction histidine kinase